MKNIIVLKHNRLIPLFIMHSFFIDKFLRWFCPIEIVIVDTYKELFTSYIYTMFTYWNSNNIMITFIWDIQSDISFTATR